MRYVVTGGCGMIGSALVRELQDQRHDVMISDIDFDGYDLREAAGCQRIVDFEPEAIIDCACRTCGISYSMTHHADMFHHATTVPMRLLDAASKMPKPPKFLVVSSSCVYPDSATVPNVETDGFVDQPESANRGYGWGKRIAEMTGLFYVEQFGMHVVAVRPANIYGPSYNWTGAQDKHVIPSLLQRMIEGENPLHIWGTGQQTRSFLYESDCAKRMIQILDKGTPGEAYNLGGDEINIHDLVHKLAALAGYDGGFVFEPDKPMGPLRKAQNIDKLKSVIPVSSTPFDEGLANVVREALAIYG